MAFSCSHEAPPLRVPPPTTAFASASAPPTVLAPSDQAQPVSLTGPDEDALDRSASPCDDFYQFACGGWMKKTPIPEDEASWVRSFSVLHDENLKALRAILERDAHGPGPADTRGDAYGEKLGDIWASCMDEAAVERRGIDDLKPELDRIDAVRDPKTLVDEIARLHAIGVGVPFGFGSEIDMKDAERMIAGVAQAGLGLPERDYYFRDDPRTKEIRAAYEKHVARTLELLGGKPKQAEADAKTVMKMETDLAAASMTNVELRDPQKVYHRLDLAGVKKLAPDVSWDGYLAAIGFPGIVSINVAQPEFVKKVDAMVSTVKAPDWRAYLRWHLARTASPWLSSRFVDEWFHFRQVLTGTKVLQPRWKRCVASPIR
jgi:putative endopeptidase